ncbi:uncharacterized protein LOC113294481 [Papaver somniferum]|uniref:uncharacterized protein LOC113294481 n=1 Tax=Papaver somniferum TaxID=3469 RepID=UPI000E6F7319|nr:uncharacterized protein LOC113294481 [Papaver somniferum]
MARVCGSIIKLGIKPSKFNEDNEGNLSSLSTIDTVKATIKRFEWDVKKAIQESQWYPKTNGLEKQDVNHKLIPIVYPFMEDLKETMKQDLTGIPITTKTREREMKDLKHLLSMDKNSSGPRLDMASNSLPLGTAHQSETTAPDHKKDIAWEWGERKDPTRRNTLTCKLCGKIVSGGITRFKYHILSRVGEVRGCPSATSDIIAKLREVEIIKNKQKVHMDQIDLMYATVDFNGESGDDEDIGVEEVEADVVAPSKRKSKGASNVRGPIEKFMKTDYSKVKQTTLERQSATKHKLKNKAWNNISYWMTENAIPFNIVCSPSFQVMLNSVGDYGKALSVPSYHHIRTNLFGKQLEEMKKFVETFKPYWKRFGCTIMSDGCTDEKGRHLINFMVNCPKGSVFLKVDASSRTNDQFYIVELVNEVLGLQILGLVTGKLLMIEHPTLYWTPCDSHRVILMLEDLGKKLNYTNNKSCYSSYKEVVGKVIVKIVASSAFWKHCDFSCKVLKPLVDVVRMVDIELKSTTSYIYEAMRLAR